MASERDSVDIYSMRLAEAAVKETKLQAHKFLRHILSKYLDVDPEEIKFSTTTEHGKPFVVGAPSAFDFSLSHTKTRVMVAVSRNRRIGIDVEYVAPELISDALIDMALTTTEKAKWLKLPASERARSFYRTWTRKEAVIKASGLGISGLPPNSFEVAHAEYPGLDRLPAPSGLREKWQLFSANPNDSTEASLAIQGDWQGAIFYTEERISEAQKK